MTNCKLYLLPFCFLIAIIDLINSLCFLTQETLIFFEKGSLYQLVFITGSFIWVFVVLLLILGLLKANCQLILIWIIVTVLGIFVDIVLLVYGTAVYKLYGTIIFESLRMTICCTVLEAVCVYIVYLYYKEIVVYVPIENDAEACRTTSATSSKTNTTSTKTKTDSSKRTPHYGRR